MDRFPSLTLDRKAIYNIYKACRLCSTDGGYKMPIIQSVLKLDSNEIELKEKIKECIGVEVSLDDRMPPLICELCIDKINDFYNFRNLCRRNNLETRAKLGLPQCTVKKNVIKPERKGLKLEETSDEDDQPIEKLKVGSKNAKLSKEVNNKVKTNTISSPEPMNQNKKELDEKKQQKVLKTNNTVLDKKKAGPKCTKMSKELLSLLPPDIQIKKLSKAGPKCSKEKISKEVLRLKADQDALNDGKTPVQDSKRPHKEAIDTKIEQAVSRTNKRNREKESSKSEVPTKRNKASESPKARPKAPRPPDPEPSLSCSCCEATFKLKKQLFLHMRTHPPTFTSDMLACNACRVWFSSFEETQRHHRQHSKKKPYICQACNKKFVTYILYNKHLDKALCEKMVKPLPDVVCRYCRSSFVTHNLMKQHKCDGKEFNCKYCNKVIQYKQNLKRHMLVCSAKPLTTAEPKINPKVKASLLDVTVRLSKCDQLLNRKKRCDASKVLHDYGLDRNSVYPYFPRMPSVVEVKSEFSPSMKGYDTMVKIYEDFAEEPIEELVEEPVDTFVHWDSDTDSDDQNFRTVKDLSTLALKVIFSAKMMGKVKRRKKRVKSECNIDSLIDNLDDDICKDSLAWTGSRGNETCDFSTFDSMKDRDSSNDSFSLLNPVENGVTASDSVVVPCVKDESSVASDKPFFPVRKVNNDSEVETCSENEDESAECNTSNDKVVNFDEIDRNSNTGDLNSSENVSFDTKDTNLNTNDINAKVDVENTELKNSNFSTENVGSVKEVQNIEVTDRLPDAKDEFIGANVNNDKISDACEEIISNIVSINHRAHSKEKENIKQNCSEYDSNNQDLNCKNTKKDENNTNDAVTDNDSNKEIHKSAIQQSDSLDDSNSKKDLPNTDELSTECNENIGSSQFVDGSSNDENSLAGEKGKDSSPVPYKENKLNLTETLRSENPNIDAGTSSNADADNKGKDSFRISGALEKTDDRAPNNNGYENYVHPEKLDDFENENNENIENEHNKVVNACQIDHREDLKAVTDTEMEDKALMDELDAQIAGYSSKSDMSQANKNNSCKRLMIDDILKPPSNDLKSLDLDNISDEDYNFDV